MHDKAIISLAAALMLAACGGGSSSGMSAGAGTGGSTDGSGGGGTGGGTTPPETGGINGGGRAKGAITGFGSIFVNGVEFSTADATIHIEDRIGTEDELRLGQVVEVRGTIDDDGTTGSATDVFFSDDLKGPIESIDVVAGTLQVLAQTVVVTDATVFDDSISPAALTGLTVGDVVEVSGFPRADGAIEASRIEPGDSAAELEIRGTVTALDEAQSRFTVGGLAVDFSGAVVADGTLSNGACVEVHGDALSAGLLTATRVQIESCGLAGAAGERGEVEGFITRFASATDFDVDGQSITTDGTTAFDGGTAQELREGLKVEVEGAFDADGRLLATRVDIRMDTSVRVLGLIDSIDTDAESIGVVGLDVSVTAATLLEDKSDARLEPLSFADLRTGDYVQARGFAAATAGTMVATVLERDNPDARNELQGTASAVAAPAFEILGVPVMTAESTEFRDASEAAITSQQFFELAPNRLVKVRGGWDGSTFVAEQAELESP